MEAKSWLTVMGLTLFLAEGFALSVFPQQFKECVAELDTRVLQIAGLLETAVVTGLILSIVLL